MTGKALRDKARSDFAAVRAILWRDWDPIGCGVPEDEYDACVWPTLGLLQRSAPAHEIAAYLRDTAACTIGCAVPDNRTDAVVARLLALELG